MFKIYVITNKCNDKVYVGQTIRPIQTRWKGHLKHTRAGRSTHFCNAIRKYGSTAFTLQEVASAPTREQINNLERLWITVLRATEREYGYNGTFGGEGLFATESTRQKQRAAHLGKKCSPEHIEQLRQAQRRRYASQEERQKTSDSITLWWKNRKLNGNCR